MVHQTYIVLLCPDLLDLVRALPSLDILERLLLCSPEQVRRRRDRRAGALFFVWTEK